MMGAGRALLVLHFLAAPLHAQQITLLQTSDLHGYIYPFDYFRNRHADIGVARVATMVESVRAEGRPVLLLDAGDTIQGSALAYVHQRKHPGPHEPTMLAMNRVGFDAMAVGNHEFNFGLEAIERARKDASFPWLSANVVTQEGEPFFEPYLDIIEKKLQKEENFVKDGMNSALLRIGMRSRKLNRRALRIAKKIGKVEVDYGDNSCEAVDCAKHLTSPRMRAQFR